MKFIVALYLPTVFRIYFKIFGFIKRLSLQRHIPRQRRLKINVIKKISQLLEKGRKGEISVWWRINILMAYNPDSDSHTGLHNFDIKSMPGWRKIDDSAKMQIIQIAKLFLTKHIPRPSTWLGKDAPYLADFTGYTAFNLLRQEDPHFVAKLPVNIWQRWAPVILGIPGITDSCCNGN